MPRTVIDVAGFEKRFQENTDPWNYRSSRFEAFKRRMLLQACGSRQHGHTLELACANGETSLALARKSLRLLAVDGSPTIVAEAQRRTAHLPHVTVALAALPDQFPLGRFDLIVVSELLYYLAPADLGRLLAKVKAALSPGGRVVLLHHTVPFDDASTLPAYAQRRARQVLGAVMAQVFRRVHHRFEVAAFVKPMR